MLWDEGSQRHLVSMLATLFWSGSDSFSQLWSDSRKFFQRNKHHNDFPERFAAHVLRLIIIEIVQTLLQKHLLILPLPLSRTLFHALTYAHTLTKHEHTCTSTNSFSLYLTLSLSHSTKHPKHKCSYLHIRLSFVFETNFQLGLVWLADLFSTFAQL